MKKNTNTENIFSEAKYGITELSKILNLHPQTIRFFEENHLVNPKRTETGIRKYSLYDAYLLQLRRSYEEIGFTLKETKDILDYDNLADIKEVFDDAKIRIQDEIEKKSFLLEGVNNLSNEMERIDFFLNKISFKVKPAHYRHSHIIGDELCTDENSNKARLLAIDLMPLSRYSIKKPYDDVVSGKIKQYLCDVIMPKEVAERYGFDKIEGSYFVEEKYCLYSIICLEALKYPSFEDCKFLNEYAIKEGFKFDGDAYCDLLINVTDKDKKLQYYELWLPIDYPI